MARVSDLLGVISNASLVAESERELVRPLSIREGLPRYDVCLFWSRSPGTPAGNGIGAVVGALARLAPWS